MIHFATDETRSEVWNMWKTVFGDPDEYMELYFREKYKNENTLIYFEENKAVASLQMLPYQFTFCGKEIPISYLSGVCTLPEARKKGYMEQLLLESFRVARQRDIPLMLLVPQEDWLLNFYDKYGFAQTFDERKEVLPSLKDLIESFPGDLHAAFREYNTWYRQSDVTVQKSFDDFRAMVSEGNLFDFPPKKNLRGMARIIDVQKLLSIFAERYEQKTFSITVHDEIMGENNASFSIQRGRLIRMDNDRGVVDQCNIRDVVQLLLGYHTSKREEPYKSVFPEKIPLINFMLE